MAEPQDRRSLSYVYLDGISLKRTWGGEVRNVSVLVAVGVGADGFRDILGVTEGCKEDKAGWSDFLGYLKRRGLKSPELIISDKCIGLIESLVDYYPEAKWQRCMVHFYRNVFTVVPKGKVKHVAAMLKAIHAQEDLEAAREKAEAVVAKLKKMKLRAAAEKAREGIEETLTIMPSLTSIAVRSVRTIRWNGSCVRSVAAVAWWAAFLTARVP